MVKLHIHALERLAERGASAEETLRTVEEGEAHFQPNTAGQASGAIFIMTEYGEEDII